LIVVAASLIPERRETFEVVLRGLLSAQTRRIDRFDIYLKGSVETPSNYPNDERIRYVRDYPIAGPWTRYLTADGLAEGDVLATVDDDTEYPPDFIARGEGELERAGRDAAVTFSGILWDPLAAFHGYVENSWRFHAYHGLVRERTVAVHMGVASFFWAGTVKNSVSFPLRGFETNDDMMIAYCLQRRGIRIICPPKPAGWIRELPTASAGHALYKRDAGARHRTFRQMVETLRFDPTAGELERYLAVPRRVLVFAEELPPLPGTEQLATRLAALCDDATGVHVLGPVPESQLGAMLRNINAPFIVHAVSVPENTGRLESVAGVRRWRAWRVARSRKRKIVLRQRFACDRLGPTEVHEYVQGALVPRRPVSG
jgi:hypothetical protein